MRARRSASSSRAPLCGSSTIPTSTCRWPTSCTERTATVTAVAVDPEQRGRGIGAALVQHSVRRFTRAGYGLLTLNCFPELENYYRGLGFTVMDAWNMSLGPLNVVGHRWGDTRVAARPLDRYTTFVDVPGLTSPVVSGILPNTRMARGAYFDGEQFRV
ncbi:GNAT family N-acetyltransferase [Streptomyces sp. NPDC048717]|uniref:GNAT family N-acetyltransferase n=1 Tax=Streptomyces sp. NPDC048717 TaxID=3154928 RepID=UPI00343B6BDB